MMTARRQQDRSKSLRAKDLQAQIFGHITLVIAKILAPTRLVNFQKLTTIAPSTPYFGAAVEPFDNHRQESNGMGQKIEVFGTVEGSDKEELLLALYVNLKVKSTEIPAKQCIKESLERRGCTVTHMRKIEVLYHEM